LSSELFDAIDYLEKEKGIDKEYLIEALEAAITSAYKKNFNSKTNVRIDLNETEGMKVFSRLEVVEEVTDEHTEIDLNEAKEIDPAYDIGDIVEKEVTPRNFGRIAAQAAKQVVTQRVREAERGVIYNDFIDRVEDIMTGKVQRKDPRFLYVHLGKIEGKLPLNELMPNESYEVHDRIKVFVTRVEKTNKGP